MTHIALCFCQINSLKAMIPELDESKDEPGTDLGEGYCGLQPHDPMRRLVTNLGACALDAYIQAHGLQGDDDWIKKRTVL
jgi:hypothetical protein